MLVLSRKKGEALIIGEQIEISILEVSGDVVKIGITAPREVDILRKELYASVETMNKAAVSADISPEELAKQFGNIKK